MTDFTINGLTAVAAGIALTTEIEVQRSGQAGTEKDTLQHVYDLMLTTTFLAADNTFSGRYINTKAGAISASQGAGSALAITGAIVTGGTATTTKPLVLIEPSTATPPTTYSTSGTAFAINTPSGFGGNAIATYNNGVVSFTVSGAGAVACGALTGSNISAGNSNNIAWTGRGILTSPAAGQIQLGAADAASPVAQTLKTQGGTGADKAGVALTIQSGNGTGAGTPSTLILQTPVAHASDSVAQTLTTGLTINNGAAVFPSYTVAGVPSASTCGAGATIYVSNEAGGAVLAFSDGTNWKRVTDRATIS